MNVPVSVGEPGTRPEEFDFPIFLDADHTHSLEKAMAAAKSGFDAIVFDLSALPFEQNVRQTRSAVQALKGINPDILVEGEIGDIGTGSEIHTQAPSRARNLTTPEEAKQYVESTGVDILAPAVGNMHGMLVSVVEGEAKKRWISNGSPRSRPPRKSRSCCTGIRDRRSRFAEGNRCRDQHYPHKHCGYRGGAVWSKA